jgi:type IV secretory pathway TraG/TraD family ATPase VirD4
MLTQLFLAARIEGLPPLPYVRKLVRMGFNACASHLASVSPDLATQFLDLQFNELNLSDRFLLSAWGTLSAKIRPVLMENAVRSFAGADFKAEDLMASVKPVTVYLRWKEQDLLALSPLVRLLWGSLIDELISTYDKKQGKGCSPVLLLADEAGRTAIPSLSDHATTVVGRGITLWIAIQSLSQLDVVYGTKRAKVLRDNMESQIYYRPSNQETADYLEHSLGRGSEYARSRTTRDGAQTSEGLSEQGVPILTAWEIKQMRDEDIIGFHRRLPPFRGKRMDWRRLPLLVKRRNIPPPVLSPLPEPDLRIAKTKPPQDDLIDPDKIQ